jgi:hypothetical protein
MPFLQKMVAVLTDELHDPVNLHAAETPAPPKLHWLKPNLRDFLFSSDMDMRWFAPVQRDKKEPICFDTQDRWHRTILHHIIA